MDEAAAFDDAFRRRAPAFRLRAEENTDREFLMSLACACSPLAVTLPRILLEQQARMQLDAHRFAHPEAMYRIVEDDEGPRGRIIVDWKAGGGSHGVDVAVMPGKREGAPGLQMLRSWIEIADRFGLSSRLEVLHDNTAFRIYERLGFAVVGDHSSPMLVMIRPPKSLG
ncbi:MAG: hypothetical protein IE933_10535 [Sphingomonadales bacterium]|nr:hypothetical protein [Sphingomonadales bacterium]MBD3772416.1 hypothetical protein [Paracoccaceae bacterium]